MQLLKEKIYTLESGETIGEANLSCVSSYFLFKNDASSNHSTNSSPQTSLHPHLKEIYALALKTSHDMEFYLINGQKYGPYVWTSTLTASKKGNLWAFQHYIDNTKQILNIHGQDTKPYEVILDFYVNPDASNWAYTVRLKDGYYAVMKNGKVFGRYPVIYGIYFADNGKSFQIHTTDNRGMHLLLENGTKHNSIPFHSEYLLKQDGTVWGFYQWLSSKSKTENGKYILDNKEKLHGPYEDISYFRFDAEESQWHAVAKQGRHQKLISSISWESGLYSFIYPVFSGSGQAIIAQAHVNRQHYFLHSGGIKEGPFNQVDKIACDESGSHYAYAVNHAKVSPRKLFNIKGQWEIFTDTEKQPGIFEEVKKIAFSKDGEKMAYLVKKPKINEKKKQDDRWHIILNSGEEYGPYAFGLSHSFIESDEYFIWFSVEEKDVFLNRLKLN